MVSSTCMSAIVHGNLKGNNILVCNDSTKLADFGLSIFAGRAAPTDCIGARGAFRWKAPEVLNGSVPTFESDVYSFGMCVIEAMTDKDALGDDFRYGYQASCADR